MVGASHQDTGWWKKIDATMTNVGRSLGIKSATGVYIFWGFILAMAVLLMIVAVLLSCRAFSCCCFRNSYGSSYSSSGRSEAYLLKASMQMPTADTRASISGFSESQAPSRVYEDYHQAVSHMIKPHQHRCAGVISIDVPGSGYDTQYHQNALQSWRTTSEYGGSDRIQAQGATFRNSMTHTAGPTLSIMDVRGGTTTDAPPMLYEIPHSGHHWETLPTSHYEITRPAHTWDYDRSSAGLNDAQYEIQRHTASEYYSHGPLATPKSRTVVVRQMHQEPYGNHFRSDSVGQPLTSYASTPREIYDENQGLEDVCGIAPPSMMGAWQVQ